MGVARKQQKVLGEQSVPRLFRMFKKFKDRLSEVSEEVKKDPRFQNSLASVNSLAEKTVAVIKNDQALRGSRESLNSQIGKKIS